MGPNQTDKIYTAKGTKKKTKRRLTEWDKIVSNDATNKGLISKIYKQLRQLNSKTNKQTKTQSENGQKTWIDIQMANKHMKKMLTIPDY